MKQQTDTLKYILCVLLDIPSSRLDEMDAEWRKANDELQDYYDLTDNGGISMSVVDSLTKRLWEVEKDHHHELMVHLDHRLSQFKRGEHHLDSHSPKPIHDSTKVPSGTPVLVTGDKS